MKVAPVNLKPTGQGLIGLNANTPIAPLQVNDAMNDQYFGMTSLDDRVAILEEMHKSGKQVADSAGGTRDVAVDDIGNSSLFFARSLEYLMSSAFDVQYAKLPFRNMFPVINEGGPGVQTIKAEVYDHFGKAKLINMGAQDVPFVAAGGKEIEYNVGLFGIGAMWNMQELHAHSVAVRNGRGRRSPQQSRQASAVRALEEALNEQAYFGTDEIDIPGFIDHPQIPKGTVAPGASGDTNWETKTADEIIADVNAIGDNIWVESKMIEMPDTLALPPSKLTILSERRIEGRDISIMQFIIKNSLFFKSRDAFVPVNEYETAGIGGTGLMTAYAKRDDKLRMEIPQEMQTLPVQQQLFSYIMLYYCYSAGLMVLFPRSIAHADGI